MDPHQPSHETLAAAGSVLASIQSLQLLHQHVESGYTEVCSHPGLPAPSRFSHVAVHVSQSTVSGSTGLTVWSMDYESNWFSFSF